MFSIKMCHPKNMTDLGSVGFDDMMDPDCKDDLLDDNVQKVVVKMVYMMSMEEKESDNKLDEKVNAGVIVDRATFQASPPPNAREVQELHLDEKVDAKICVDVHIDHVKSPQKPSLIDNVKRFGNNYHGRMNHTVPPRKAPFETQQLKDDWEQYETLRIINGYEHVAMNSTRHRLTAATVKKPA
uniref:Uncharacterized protein n=1 Tax=Tanacetum cinerariifolium TaxID=118510 RepID=A0A6L2MBT7_TANCI|nr:hypothetical protein [Tanacetum cinerariifolium]